MPRIKGKTVLVTGGAGFIGSHLADRLLAEGAAKVVVVDNFFLGKLENLEPARQAYGDRLVIVRDDARQLGVMQAVIEREQVEVVFNLATLQLKYSFFNPIDAYQVNVDIMKTLLTLMKTGAFTTLIHTSTSEAYGTAVYEPMDENHPLCPTTPYAAGKVAADMMALTFRNVLDLDLAVIRPFNNYGSRQNAGDYAAIIPQTARRILQGLPPILEGDGEQTQDFVFVEDTTRAFLTVYEDEASRGQVVNIGTGREISMRELVEKIAVYYGYTGPVEIQPGRRADVRRMRASGEKAAALLGYRTEYTLETALPRVLDWYREQYTA